MSTITVTMMDFALDVKLVIVKFVDQQTPVCNVMMVMFGLNLAIMESDHANLHKDVQIYVKPHAVMTN